MPRVLLHGLQIDSPLDLAGAAPRRGCAAELVRVKLAEGPVATPRAEEAIIQVDESTTGRHYAVWRDGPTWVVTFPGKAAVRWADGDDTLQVTARAGVPDALLSVLLCGPALVGLLIARGETLVHASAVVLRPGPHDNDRAVAFLGPAGAGKSTLAHLLSGSKAPLLSDDALRMDLRGAGVVVHRGTTRSRLRRGSPVPTPSTSVEFVSEDGRRVLASVSESPETSALGLIVVPRLSPAFDRIRLRPLAAVEAVMAIATSWPVEGIREPELRRRQLVVAAQLVKLVPVMEAEVPWRGGDAHAPLIDELRGALMRQVELGDC